jgi:hypothetical protein
MTVRGAVRLVKKYLTVKQAHVIDFTNLIERSPLVPGINQIFIAVVVGVWCVCPSAGGP